MAKPLADIKRKVTQARSDIEQAHMEMNDTRMDPATINKVRQCRDELLGWQEIEESILRQRSKLKWLRLGDGNNKYFHATIKARQTSNSIYSLQKEDDTILKTHEDIEEEILTSYRKLMGTAEEVRNGIDVSAMREGPQLNNDQRVNLTVPVTEQEVVNALHNIDDMKAPGKDGYEAYFFKKSWTIMKKDIMRVVDDFFVNGKLFKPAKCTLVTLIPKSKEAKMIKEYRPISCCSTLYKIISKIITIRMGKVLNTILGQNQAAFIPGQVIHNHILLTYELMRGYSRHGGTPRCMVQMDIQKAYDTIDWRAMEHVLIEVGFPRTFVNWIMLAVTSVTYQFNINGTYTKAMEARRGLRQGDHMSPLLFIIMMEYLNRCLNRLKNNPNFNFHSKCEKLNITNLCFVDDLLLFARGDVESARLMMTAYNVFSLSTGLKYNPAKCCIFFGGCGPNR